MRRLLVGFFVVAALIVGAGALVVSRSKIPKQAITSSVTSTPELLERAPVAAKFNRQIN
jgi:hypothetical protein